LVRKLLNLPKLLVYVGLRCMFVSHQCKANIQVMKLTKKAKAAINKSTRLKNLLAVEFDCSVFTIKRWLDDDDVRLTAPSATNIIKKETELKDDQILEPERVKA
jgi:hypothetical protein